MSKLISTKEAERRAVRLSLQDGLWEILLGLTILSLSASVLLRDILGVPINYIPVILVFAVGIPLTRRIKKDIVIPRLGSVQFGSKRRRKFKIINIVLISLVVFTWLFVLIPNLVNLNTDFSNWPYWFVDAIFGLLLFGFFALLSITLETPRIAVYGLLFGLSLPADIILREALGTQVPIFNILTGCVITVWGTITFIQFLRNYPLPEQSSLSDGRASSNE